MRKRGPEGRERKTRGFNKTEKQELCEEEQDREKGVVRKGVLKLRLSS